MKTALVAALVLPSLVLPAIAHAQPGTVTFAGEVTSDTCVVAPIGNGPISGSDFTVVLPSINRYSLASAGQRGAAIPFHVVVGSGERPCRMQNVQALFRNAGDNNPAGRLSNQGSADHVDVVVQNKLQEDIDLNSNANTQIVPIDPTGIGVLSWFASYHATGAATPGTVAAHVEYVLVYP